jgi:nicotinamidase-related amidase
MALVIIDMQHDFVDPGAGCYAIGAEQLVPRIVVLRDAFRAADLPVVVTQERHRPGVVDSGREADVGTGAMYGAHGAAVPSHCVTGTRGFEVAAELAPGGTDLVVEKARYGCFMGSDLHLLLRNLASQLDYHVTLVEDCLAGTSVVEHEAAIVSMRGLLGTAGVTADDVLAHLAAMPVPAGSLA